MTIQTARVAATATLQIPPRPELLFGQGAVHEASVLVRRLGHEAALVVTDRGLVDAGVAGQVLGLLRGAGMELKERLVLAQFRV